MLLSLDAIQQQIAFELPQLKLLPRDQMQTIYDYWKKRREASKGKPLLRMFWP